MTDFKSFRVGDLFDIHPTKAYNLKNDELYAIPGATPVLSNSSVDNGVGGFVDRPPTEGGGIITFSDTTTGPDTMFYQPGPFIGYPHVQGMYPFDIENWTEKPLLYFIGALRKVCGNGFDYATKFNRKIVSNKLVPLPVDKNGNIDFEYMRERIEELERERIEELERERIEELERYLLVSGLDDYQLTDEDVASLSLFGSRSEEDGFDEEDCQPEKIIWKKMKLEDIIDIKSPDKHFNANAVIVYVTEEKGSYPYVVRKSGDNGMKGYIVEDERYLSPSGSISFGQDTATAFYQDRPYFTGDKIKVLTLKNGKMAENVGLFLVSVIRKAFQMFQWGQSSFDEEVLKSIEIMLPSSDGVNPDYSLMERYVLAQKKLAIRDVIQMKDSIIENTKMVVNR